MEYLGGEIIVCVIRVELVRGKRRVSYVSGRWTTGKMSLREDLVWFGVLVQVHFLIMHRTQVYQLVSPNSQVSGQGTEKLQGDNGV